MPTLLLLTSTTAMCVCVSLGAAQRPAAMPVRDTTRLTVGMAMLQVDHDAMVSSDSSLIGRVIPLGTWMMGSRTPGHLISNADVVIDEKPVSAGSYSLWVLVTRESATLIVNRDPPTAGMRYDSSHDVARVPLSVERADSTLPRFRVRLDPAPRRVSDVRFTFLKPENPSCSPHFQCFGISVGPANTPDAMLLLEWQRIRWMVSLRFAVDSTVKR
jgi:hypothetical protein